MAGRRFMHTLRQSIPSEAVEAAKDGAVSVASFIFGGVIGYKFTNWLYRKHMKRVIQEASEEARREQSHKQWGHAASSS